jgi:hypothetical protein
MGLTLHFSLALPSTTPRDEVTDRLRQLRSAATRLPLERVGPLTITSPSSLGSDPENRDPLSGMFKLWAWLQLDPATTGVSEETLPDAVGFAVLLGAQAEAAVLGLAWIPPVDDNWHLLPDEPSSWRWHSACKTQYASNESEDHFVTCHTTLVALLDEAVRLGFAVDVTDEGEYWEWRDVDRLRSRVRDMNGLIAQLGGALHDAIGQDHSVEAAIFEHPEFERLEMEPLTRLKRPEPPAEMESDSAQ